MKLVTPMELYAAARETCLRLYVINGGNPKDKWTIQPYPGTAAISCKRRWDGTAHWVLCMPAFPMNVRLPRWQADLVAAYTVHELLHSLWSDWDAVQEAIQRGVGKLQNALEDCRIEARACRGGLTLVSEARRLLEALNAHIVRRAMAAPGFTLASPANFAFILGLVIFREKVGYRSDLPANWRARVRPEWLPLIDHALARFDGLASTADVLALCDELKAMADATPQTPRQEPQEPRQEPEAGQEAPEYPDELDEPQEAPEAGQEAPGQEPDADDADQDADDAGPADGPADASQEPPEADQEPGTAGTLNLTDTEQVYEEANLDDVAEEAREKAGVDEYQALADAENMSTVMNAPALNLVETTRGANPARATEYVSNPAKIKRHLTLAVKSPERIGRDRHQSTGRLDMRDIVGVMTGRNNVFSRRVEEEGREAAVTLLIDMSGSMKGEPLLAAKALAIHLGDALKAAGTKFEVLAFNDQNLIVAKSIAKPWNTETKRHIAGINQSGGTAMLPAIRTCVERLLKVGNVSRRIVLALTDGVDGYKPEANNALMRWSKLRGVEVVGITLQTYCDMSVTFDNHVVDVKDPSKLSEQGLSALTRALGN